MTIRWSFFTKIWPKKWFHQWEALYGYLGPHPPKIKKIKNNGFHQKGHTHILPKSRQGLSNDHFLSRYDKNPLDQSELLHGYLGPHPPKMKKMKNNGFHQKGVNHTLLKSPQWLSDVHFSPRYAQKTLDQSQWFKMCYKSGTESVTDTHTQG